LWDGARHTLFPVAGIWRSAPYRSYRLPAPRRYSMRQHMAVSLIAGPSMKSLSSISSEASQHGSPQVCRLRSAAPARVSTASGTLYLFPRGLPLPGSQSVCPKLRVWPLTSQTTFRLQVCRSVFRTARLWSFRSRRLPAPIASLPSIPLPFRTRGA